jgi:hypothetical protein
MWQRILKKCNWNNIDFRDNRYDQVIHLVSSANGAHQFYQCSEIRTEGIGLNEISVFFSIRRRSVSTYIKISIFRPSPAIVRIF